MLEIEDLLLSPVTALVPRHAAACVPQLDDARVGLRLYLRAGRQRRRIRVRQHLHTAQSVHRREAGLRQVRAFRGQRQKMLALDHQASSYPLLAPGDHAPFVLLTGG